MTKKVTFSNVQKNGLILPIVVINNFEEKFVKLYEKFRCPCGYHAFPLKDNAALFLVKMNEVNFDILTKGLEENGLTLHPYREHDLICEIVELKE